jgi:hypothetical protein
MEASPDFCKVSISLMIAELLGNNKLLDRRDVKATDHKILFPDPATEREVYQITESVKLKRRVRMFPVDPQ